MGNEYDVLVRRVQYRWLRVRSGSESGAEAKALELPDDGEPWETDDTEVDELREVEGR